MVSLLLITYMLDMWGEVNVDYTAGAIFITNQTRMARIEGVWDGRENLQLPISDPDFVLADSVFQIQYSRHKTQDMIDKGKFIIYSQVHGFLVTRYRSKAGYSRSKIFAGSLFYRSRRCIHSRQ